MDRADSKKRRDGDFAVCCTVGEDDDVHALAHGCDDLVAELVKRLLQCVISAVTLVGGEEAACLESLMVDSADAVELVLREDRALETHEAAVVAHVLEEVAMVAEIEQGRRHEALTKRIDRRVRKPEGLRPSVP